jgi:hypothetical protein
MWPQLGKQRLQVFICEQSSGETTELIEFKHGSFLTWPRFKFVKIMTLGVRRDRNRGSKHTQIYKCICKIYINFSKIIE